MLFQYILCYGSTLVLTFLTGLFSNFNTSYVTVQPMSLLASYLHKKKFQYILCYGSTKNIKRVRIVFRNFNTSYVTVQQLC